MGKTVAVMLGRGSLAHNNRTFSTENVDHTLTTNNVVFIRQKPKDAYQEIFGEALERYNQKQKRNDRKIPDYYEHIRQSRNGEKLYHEIVVQVGNRNDTGIGSADADRAKEILVNYYQDFLKRNPNMRVFNAVLHMDEPDGTPHLHIDFIPVATGQTRGLEMKNSMRQALEQQGFEFQPTPVPKEEIVSVSYGKRAPKIGGGRWLEAERAQIGAILAQHGIEWERKDTRREHLTISEYKACAEIINKEIQNTPPTELKCREPNTAMRLAGVKSDEILLYRPSVDALQQENQALRAQAAIDCETICHMDTEKRSSDEYIQRAIKTAMERERRANFSVQQAKQEIVDAKAQYSAGTAEKYHELYGEYGSLKSRYMTLAEETARLKESVPRQINNAVDVATAPLNTENNRLRDDLEQFKKIATALKEQVRGLCQTLHDVMRAVFTLKYNYKDKTPNPFKSTLTESADHLIDALERKSCTALLDADCPDLEKNIGGMGLTPELEQEVRGQLSKPQKRSHEIGG